MKWPTLPQTTPQSVTNRSDIEELAGLFKHLLATQNPNMHFKAPRMSLSNIEDSGDHIDAITYHLWRKRLNQQMLTFGLTPEQVYNMLIDSSSKLLPQNWINEIWFCRDLQGVFTTLDNINQGIELTLPTLINKILNLPMAQNGTSHVIERTTELLKSLDQLHSLHPHHNLQHHEVLKILYNLNSQTTQNVIYELVSEWRINQHTISFEHSLHKYLVTLRKSSIDLLAALRRSGTNMPHYTQLGTQSNPEHPESPQKLTQSQFKGGHFNRRLQKHIKGHCGVCESDHIENFSNCPKLEHIKMGKSELPNSLCLKCLKPKLPGNEKHNNCNIYTFKNSGKTVNCICSIHKYTHYKICRKCPANEYNPTQPWTRKEPVTPNFCSS